MLQEDYENKISCYLGLMSCLKYIENPNPEPWDPELQAQAEEDSKKDEDEEVKVRVPFLARPYFDDHFDLREWKPMVGKTLVWVSRNLKLDANDPLMSSCQLLGHALWGKWDIVQSLSLGQSHTFTQDAVSPQTFGSFQVYRTVRMMLHYIFQDAR